VTDAQPESAPALRVARPGALWPWVKRASWFELGLFAALCFFWLAPGFEHETFIFGAAHGIGYVALCVLILVAVLRRQAPYILLAASLTPVGPLGSVIAIGWIERKRSDIRDGSGGAGGGRGSTQPAPPPARR
jgi:hypothetical protein